eukprot:c33749_g1_i1 orf=143-412(+)
MHSRIGVAAGGVTNGARRLFFCWNEIVFLKERQSQGVYTPKSRPPIPFRDGQVFFTHMADSQASYERYKSAGGQLFQLICLSYWSDFHF